MRNFEIKEHIEGEVTLNYILRTSEDSLIGFTLEVDLEYPEVPHDIHQDYPLAPTKETEYHDWLSTYPANLIGQIGNQEAARRSIGKTKKLLQTMHDNSI